MTIDNGLVYFFVFVVATILFAIALYFLGGFVDAIRDLFNG